MIAFKNSIAPSEGAEPFYVVLDQIDAEWCLNQARMITENYEVTMSGSASGKFLKNYQSYQFGFRSNLPLISKFVEAITEKEKIFNKFFDRKVDLSLVQLTHVKDPTKQISIPHKDNYWMNGQFHLTILGNANILIWAGQRDCPTKDEHLLRFENGTVWYINSTTYFHTIHPLNVSDGPLERFELTAPLGGHAGDLLEPCISQEPDCYISPHTSAFKKMKEHQISLAKKSFAEGKASSPEPAGFIEGFE